MLLSHRSFLGRNLGVVVLHLGLMVAAAFELGLALSLPSTSCIFGRTSSLDGEGKEGVCDFAKATGFLSLLLASIILFFAWWLAQNVLHKLPLAFYRWASLATLIGILWWLLLAILVTAELRGTCLNNNNCGSLEAYPLAQWVIAACWVNVVCWTLLLLRDAYLYYRASDGYEEEEDAVIEEELRKEALERQRRTRAREAAELRQAEEGKGGDRYTEHAAQARLELEQARIERERDQQAMELRFLQEQEAQRLQLQEAANEQILRTHALEVERMQRNAELHKAKQEREAAEWAARMAEDERARLRAIREEERLRFLKMEEEDRQRALKHEAEDRRQRERLLEAEREAERILARAREDAEKMRQQRNDAKGREEAERLAALAAEAERLRQENERQREAEAERLRQENERRRKEEERRRREEEERARQENERRKAEEERRRQEEERRRQEEERRRLEEERLENERKKQQEEEALLRAEQKRLGDEADRQRREAERLAELGRMEEANRAEAARLAAMAEANRLAQEELLAEEARNREKESQRERAKSLNKETGVVVPKKVKVPRSSQNTLKQAKPQIESETKASIQITDSSSESSAVVTGPGQSNVDEASRKIEDLINEDIRRDFGQVQRKPGEPEPEYMSWLKGKRTNMVVALSKIYDKYPQVLAIKRTFDSVDNRDGISHGYLNQQEFVENFDTLFPMCKKGMGAEYAAYLFHSLDADGNGTITWKEFIFYCLSNRLIVLKEEKKR